MKSLFLSIACLFMYLGYSQTATLQFLSDISTEEYYYDYWKTFTLSVNGRQFTPADTLEHTIKLNRKGLDKCFIIHSGDTLFFFAKFKKGENYIVNPGCCCTDFTLSPKNNPRRGTVSFKNKTKRPLFLIAAETNIEEVAPGAQKTTFAGESAMCMFKPCSIAIAEENYYDPKYDYHYNDGQDHKALSAEQDSYISGMTWFHFLHGEKIIVQFNDAKKEIQLKMDGYLTDNEFNTYHPPFNFNPQ
jgi:hypothetical protein